MQGMYRAFAEEVIGMLAAPELHNGISDDLALYPFKRASLPPLIRFVIIGNHKHVMFRLKLWPGKPLLKIPLAQRLRAVHPRRRLLDIDKRRYISQTIIANTHKLSAPLSSSSMFFRLIVPEICLSVIHLTQHGRTGNDAAS